MRKRTYEMRDLVLDRIISGGQTGADQGGLLAGQKLGIRTGGTAPKGWWTETGADESRLRGFGLVECSEPGYDVRTRQNVLDADGTLLLGNYSAGGSALTMKIIRELGKPVFHIPFPAPGATPELLVAEFREWLTRHKIRILNVAGNRESQNPGLQEHTKQFLISAIGTSRL